MPRIPERDTSAEQERSTPGLPPSAREPAAQPGASSPADLAHMSARLNEATVTDAHASLLDRVNSLLHDPATGYLNLQGKDAVSSFNTALDALGKLPTQLVDTLHDDTQRAMFQRASSPTLNAAIAQVQQHAARQMDHYETQASHARAAAAADLAANAWNPKPGADNTP